MKSNFPHILHGSGDDRNATKPDQRLFLSDGCDGIAGAICSVFTAFREVVGVRTFQIGIFEDGKQTAQLKSLGVQI